MYGGSHCMPQKRAVCSITGTKLENGWACMPDGVYARSSPPAVATHRQCLPESAVPPSPYAHPSASTFSNQCLRSAGTLYQ